MQYFYAIEPVAYTRALEWQRNWMNDRRHSLDLDDILLMLEHPPVYTLGQGSNRAFLQNADRLTGVEVHRVERGGEVTYHCPGQLVAYPILNLNHYRKDLHWYLRQLEEVVIRSLAYFGLKGDRIPQLTGVWVEGRKVAAIGIKASRWVTMHGFALNVCPDLQGFEYIVPCGITDRSVGSIAQWIPGITLEEVRPIVASTFAGVFDVEWVANTTREVPAGLHFGI